MLRQNSSNQLFSIFISPYLELIRLLHEASEIEHALMLQYLYAGFSINTNYTEVASGLRRIFIDEMRHLGKVSKFLSALGGSPHLLSQDFPYFQDIYPFPLNLEPLSRNTAAKYTYVEAAAAAIAHPSPEEEEFVKDLLYTIGPDTLPNQLGSLYNRILEVINNSPDELIEKAPDIADISELNNYKETIENIKDEGETAHYVFFKSVFLGDHPDFSGIPNIWSLEPSDPKYPSIDISTNPSAYRGSKNQITDPEALQIAYLSNLHYWIILLLLDLYYRYGENSSYLRLAIRHMTGAVEPLGEHLVKLAKTGLPFDASPIGYNTGKSEAIEKNLINYILVEAKQIAESFGLLSTVINESLYNPISE